MNEQVGKNDNGQEVRDIEAPHPSEGRSEKTALTDPQEPTDSGTEVSSFHMGDGAENQHHPATESPATDADLESPPRIPRRLPAIVDMELPNGARIEVVLSVDNRAHFRCQGGEDVAIDENGCVTLLTSNEKRKICCCLEATGLTATLLGALFDWRRVRCCWFGSASSEPAKVISLTHLVRILLLMIIIGGSGMYAGYALDLLPCPNDVTAIVRASVPPTPTPTPMPSPMMSSPPPSETLSTQPTTPPTTSSNTIPEAQIQKPESTVRLFGYDGYNSALRLWYIDVDVLALAFDKEDGTLDGSSVVWKTDQAGVQDEVLGRGSSTTIRLFSSNCPGSSHNIYVEATDSDGNVATSLPRTVTIENLC